MKVLATATTVTVSVLLSACGGGGEMASPEPAAMPEAAPTAATSTPGAAEQILTTNDASLLSDPTWAVLFSGHDLMTFDQLGGANWEIVDGVVGADDRGEPGWLVTKAAFTDFHLRVEFQASAESNSGVFVRCEDPNGVSAESCYEVNVFDQNENPDNRTGAIVAHAPPAVAVTAGDAWNTFDIIAEGTNLTVQFNGTVTAELDDDTHASGYIGLQSNGGPIKFRDVRIRPL
jgi:hypothetical protein